MAEKKTPVETLREDIIKKIDEFNAALKDNDNAKMTAVEQELKEAENSYIEAKSEEVFEELSKSDNPIKAAVERHSFMVVGHKANRTEGVLTGYELKEDKVRQIDLIKLCKYCKLPTNWQYKVEKFNQLLALRAANELKMTKAQIKKLCDSFYMNELARQVEMGETPDSNTAVCKQLQTVVDAILFEDNGKGKNLYRVNNHDVAYLTMCYTRRGKKVLSVAVAKNQYIHRLVVDVMHRIVTNKAYDLEYKMVSEKVSEPKTKAESKPVEKEKVSEPETVVIEKPAK